MGELPQPCFINREIKQCLYLVLGSRRAECNYTDGLNRFWKTLLD